MYGKRWIAPAAVMAAAFWVQGASAADVTMEPAYVAPPVPEEVWNWTGIHIGLDLGGQFDLVDSYVAAHNENAIWAGFGFANSQDIESEANLGAQNFFVSGDIGADFQAGSFVVGLFANYDWAPHDSSASHEANDSQSCPLIGGCNNPFGFTEATTTSYKEVSNTVTYGDAWGVGARAGVLVNPRALVYVLGGYGQKQIMAESYMDYVYFNGQEFEGGLSSSGWRPGWFVGTGVEAAVGNHATVALEYRMAQYKGFSASCSIPDCVESTPGGYEFNSHEFEVGKTISHTIRARLSLWLN
jgi:opacity protein-like surface antigen